MSVDPAQLREFANMISSGVVEGLRPTLAALQAASMQPGRPVPPQQIGVVRRNPVTGQPETRVSTLAQQIGELNDNLLILNLSIAELNDLMRETLDESADSRPSRRSRR